MVDFLNLFSNLPFDLKFKLSLDPLLAFALDTAKNADMYRLHHLRTGTTLADDLTLQQQGVRNNGRKNYLVWINNFALKKKKCDTDLSFL